MPSSILRSLSSLISRVLDPESYLVLQGNLFASFNAVNPELIGLSAVVETTDGTLSYWALAHPRAQPDFHHPVGWTARVPDNRRP